jgi:hypothetical protein
MATTHEPVSEATAAFSSATTESLAFLREEILSHWDRPTKRVGFKLVAVAGIPVPAWVRLAYVVGEAGFDRFTYVVLLSHSGNPKIHGVTSEGQAKDELLRALRALIGLPIEQTGG